MKRLVLSLVAAVCVTTAFAAERTPEQIARSRAKRAAALVAKGGLVRKVPDGNVVRIVSAQRSVDAAALREIARAVGTGLRVGIEVTETAAGKCALEDAEKALKLPKTGIVLLVVDDPKLPTLLSAPENAWAILNIRSLNDDMPPKEVYDLRVRKEVCRGLASACGVGLSYNKPCVMESVYTKTALDNLKMNIVGPESISKMLDAAQLRGIKPIKVATYLTACEEGWAPAPTNDVQKAIWEKVHAMPTEPIKIKPETKKVEK